MRFLKIKMAAKGKDKKDIGKDN
jgi:hypothetical protein